MAVKIWDTYIKTKDPVLREKLILEYVPIVKVIAGRLAVQFNGHVEFDDMVSYGVFGLIDAVDKFDADKGVKFETYASLRIKGAIIDNIRRMDWAPRSLRQENRRLEQAFKDLETELGREPKNQELADRLGLPLEETLDIIRKSTMSAYVSLDDHLEQNGENTIENPAGADSGPEDEALKKEARKLLEDAIDNLSEKERLVTTLYYFEELTLKEISKIMKVTESRVSQIHSKAVLKLRTRLSRYSAYFNF